MVIQAILGLVASVGFIDDRQIVTYETNTIFNSSQYVRIDRITMSDTVVLTQDNSAFIMPSTLMTNSSGLYSLKLSATLMVDDASDSVVYIDNFLTYRFGDEDGLLYENTLKEYDYTLSGYMVDNDVNCWFTIGSVSNIFNNYYAYSDSNIYWGIDNILNTYYAQDVMIDLRSNSQFTLYLTWDTFPSDTFIDAGSSYNLGYNDGYTKGYDEGETDGTYAGYEDGYLYGYDIGFAEGENTANTYTFGNLFKSIVDTPIWFLQSLFGFSLFGQGETLMGIITSLITALIVIALVKKVF